MREIAVLREVRGKCRGIVELYDIAVSSQEGVYLVFEYCRHDLSRLINNHYKVYKKSPFTPPQAKRLFLELLAALKHMHERNLLHRDLKMSNLLYDERGQLKVCDFGLARRALLRSNKLTKIETVRRPSERAVITKQRGAKRRACKGSSLRSSLVVLRAVIVLTSNSLHQQQQKMTPNVVSMWYRPPELLLGSEFYGESIDIWGAGCIFSEFFNGQPLFRGKTELDQWELIRSFKGCVKRGEWAKGEQLPKVVNGGGSASKFEYFEMKIGGALSIGSPSTTSKTVSRIANLTNTGRCLLDFCLEYNPQSRCTASTASEHQFFKDEPLATRPERMPVFP